jgi:hypothetical protein
MAYSKEVELKSCLCNRVLELYSIDGQQYENYDSMLQKSFVRKDIEKCIELGASVWVIVKALTFGATQDGLLSYADLVNTFRAVMNNWAKYKEYKTDNLPTYEWTTTLFKYVPHDIADDRWIGSKQSI